MEARIEAIGVVGRDLDGLNVVLACTRARDTEDGICAFPRSEETLFVDFVDFGARAGFRRDSSCRSRANRRVSFVRPERLNDGVCGGITFAVGGVFVSPDNSLAVPKLEGSQANSV